MNWLKLAIIAAAVVVITGIGWKIHHSIDKGGYDRAQGEYQAAAELQREANRGRVDKAATAEVSKTVYRDRYFVTTVKEFEHATQNLASCLVGDDAVRMFRDATRCARESGAAGCFADGGVSNP